MAKKKLPVPLEFKPDLADAARRWDAFYAGELIDRPVVSVTAPKPNTKPVPGTNYHDRVHGNMDEIIDRQLAGAANTYYGGEAVPAAWLSFGCDEVAAFCGQAELHWNPDSGDTCWSKPLVTDWADALPLRLRDDNPLWQRMLELYRRTAAKVAGKMLIAPLDLHTNMDLLAGVRGSQQLCLDVIEQPEMIDRAMKSARAVFPKLWRAISQAGKMDEYGYCAGPSSRDGAAFLQCDFSCMVSSAMFRRWVLPALEEEAAIVKHVVYHWDGPQALTLPVVRAGRRPRLTPRPPRPAQAGSGRRQGRAGLGQH